MNLKIQKKILPKNEAGFTIIDVIVAILIASIFLLVSGQAMLLAAYARMKAQETSEGLLLIQKDLEEIKYKASLLALTSSQKTAMCTATSASAGFAQNLLGQIGTYPKTVSIKDTKQYVLSVTPTISNIPPYSVLRLQYQIKPNITNAKVVAELYTEVIPDVAFDCN